MPWQPSAQGERPTLGWLILDWIEEFLGAPDRAEYEPFEPTDEQASFLLRFYELHPVTGKRIIRRGVLSRPRGWGKSPFLAAIAAAEALGPVVFEGWDAAGQPVGMPWSEIRTPTVQIAAVSEEQTKNSWTPLLEMLREGPIIDTPGLEVMETFVNLPRGKIETITSSASTVKGNRTVFAVCDQTEEWTRGNGGHRLYEVMRANSGKLGGSLIESPNAYIPGMDSVAEQTANAAALKAEGKTRAADGILYDHREAPADTDLTDRASTLSGLRISYGDSAKAPKGWVDLDRLIEEGLDTDMDPQVFRADYLNQITHASDSWLSQPEWEGCKDTEKVISPDEPIVMGFDGSRKRARGITDATALMGCRISDGHLFTIEVWEQPQNVAEWEVPTAAVDATVRECFTRWKVVGFYADPAMWEGYIAKWEADFRKLLKIKSTANHPIEWWMNRHKIVIDATRQLHDAIVDTEMTHDGSSVLTRHMLNARRRTGGHIGKAFDDSPRKIDAAVASILAWQARLDALAAGLARPRNPGGKGRVIVMN